MTRETKIGLLVGLGFIVVFAVLLSHTGDPAGDSITPSLVQNQPANKPVLSGDIRGEIGQPEPVPPAVEAPRTPGSSPEAEPVSWPVEDRVVSIDDLPDLPAPPSLNPSPVSTEFASADSKRGDLKPENPVSILGMHRTAPEPVTPAPTVPHDPPPSSNPPAPSTPTAAVVMADNSNAAKSAPQATAPREYVVQSKDSLVKIAQKHYKSSDPKVIQAIVKANEGQIKNADSIVEGQKIRIPDLPPEMFEQVPGVQLASGVAKIDELINGNGKDRKAPVSPNPSPETKSKPNSTREEKAPAKPADNTKTKTAEPAGKPPVQDSAPRLSLSGFVPVRPSATTSDKTVKPETKPATEKALKPSTDTSSKKETARDAKPKVDASEKGDQLHRWYEIKPNDTMGSIARKELGSSQHWQDIKKLNNGLDPQKMKPGDRIKLPRKPVSRSAENGRTSA